MEVLMFRTLADGDGKFMGFENEKQRTPRVRVKLPRKVPRRKAPVLAKTK